MRGSLRKALLAAIMAAAVVPLAVWATGGGEKAAAAPATIRVMIADNSAEQRTASKLDEQNNPYTDYLFARTGVRVILDRQDSSSYNDKVTLVLASGSAPDFISMGGNDAFSMNIARSGALEELSPYLGTYANINRVYDAAYWNQYSFDNKKYVLKGITIAPLSARAVLIRQDWLDKLNLKMPQTVNDLRAVAAAFVKARPDGQTVFGQTGRANFSYFYALSSAYGNPSPDVQMGYWYIDKASRKLVFWNTTDAARAYFTEALRWNKEGLLDPELLSSTGGSFWDKINAGNVGIICHRAESVGWLSTSIRQAQKRPEPTLAVVPALKGTGFKNQYGKEGGFEQDYLYEGYYGVPKGNKNVDAVLKVMDFEDSKEFADFRVFGVEGIEHTVVNGKKVLNLEKMNLVSFVGDYYFTVDRSAMSQAAKDAYVETLSGGGDTANNYLYDTAESALARTKAGLAVAAGYGLPSLDWASGIPRLDVETQYPDVQGAYLALYVKLITGDWDASRDADWNAYLAAVEKAGIPAITKAKQEYLLANSPKLFQ